MTNNQPPAVGGEVYHLWREDNEYVLQADGSQRATARGSSVTLKKKIRSLERSGRLFMLVWWKDPDHRGNRLVKDVYLPLTINGDQRRFKKPEYSMGGPS